MNPRSARRRCGIIKRQAQAGMVMMVALIILIAMTLGGLALMRSMDTTNLIAGNMAFQQAATHSADAGIEAAVAWLETTKPTNNGTGLYDSIPSTGYTASSTNNAASARGAAFWAALSPAGVCSLPMVNSTTCSTAPGTPDASGNNISFMIQRLCNGTGDPNNNAGCGSPPAGSINTSATNTGNNEGAGEDVVDAVGSSTSMYYRITVRVAGPRNTESYVQAIVSL